MVAVVMGVGLLLVSTLVHEFGHVIGLNHSQFDGTLTVGALSGIGEFAHGGAGGADLDLAEVAPVDFESFPGHRLHAHKGAAGWRRPRFAPHARPRSATGWDGPGGAAGS